MTADALQVSGWMDALSGLIERYPRLWIGLGNLESRLLRDEIESIAIKSPIYVTGLARSGSTILLELLAQHPCLATHRYRDFPAVLTPQAWNWFVDRAASGEGIEQERAHRDRIKVTPESPEAFEEVIWMAFFEQLHDPGKSGILDRQMANASFEAFYRDHIRKLLLLRDRERYLSKANYNVTRLPYLQKLFPDARFVVPIRSPIWHVASLMKQHVLFSREGERNVRVRRHMRRSGHFEFGLDRRAIHVGDDAAAARVQELWNRGSEVEGWAEYWALVYGHLASLLDEDPQLRAACHVVRYEDFCASPAVEMAAILRHSGIEALDLPQRAEARVRAPEYYRPSFSPDEEAVIRDRTQATARRFGYA